MSTTTPDSSSSPRRKAASTTNVAPCSRWAGPNMAPVKLCATIMWSRTVTLNTWSSPVVVDRVAEGGGPAVGEPPHDLRQVLERGHAGEQRVEGRVAQELQREPEPVPGGPRTAAGRRPVAGGPGAAGGRRHRADLAGPYPQPLRVEGAAQRHGHLPVAVPAEFQ